MLEDIEESLRCLNDEELRNVKEGLRVRLEILRQLNELEKKMPKNDQVKTIGEIVSAVLNEEIRRLIKRPRKRK